MSLLRSLDLSRVFAGIITAGVTGALSVTFIALSYLPSYVITVMKFRSGVLGSLHDRRSMYLNKMNPFFATLLVGSSFWGAAFSGTATGICFGSIVYLLLWEESKPFAVAAFAVFIGKSYVCSSDGNL
jgi:tetrahydromethanopterin S-methyltransferase subunit E